MSEPMIRVQKGAYAAWRLLGLTPALALVDGRTGAAATIFVVWAAGFWALRAALARLADTATLAAYLRHPALRVAGLTTLVLAQSWAVLVSGVGAIGVLMLAAVIALTVAAASRDASVFGRRLAGGLVAAGTLVTCLLVLELALWGVEASRPANDAHRFTWGRAIRHNALGFREREIRAPKPAGTYRVMVVGDSLTWGVGLAEEQRYSRLLEHDLQRRWPDRTVEVLNFGLRGLATVHQRDHLMRLIDVVEPDCVVVGFCVNDPQPRRQSYAVEMERYRPIFAAFGVLNTYGLGRTAAFLHKRTDQLVRNVGLVPQWPEALDRAYRRDSPEWQAFEQALADIRTLCVRRGLAPPVFASLLQGTGDYGAPDPLLARFVAWSAQAEAAARAHGFATVNMLESFRAQGYRDRRVNPWDGHPSAECNRIYAAHIAEAITRLEADDGAGERLARGDTG